MTVEIEVIPISNDTDRFYCSILRIGSIRILLDCGWDERLNVSDYESLPLSTFATIDAIFLSHYSLSHVGALPYLIFRSWGRKLRFIGDYQGPRLIATEAVRRLGELSLASLHEDLDKIKNVSVSDDSYSMSIEDIVSAFSLVQAVQFNESVAIAKGDERITVTFQPAGKLIGGAYCVITVGSQRIVYATDYALSAGKAIGGLAIEPARSPSVLITDSAPAGIKNTDALVSSNQAFLGLVKQTLRNGGSVLIPVDPTGDILELLLLLESAIAQDASLQVYPAAFVSPLGDVVLDQVKTRMEWLNEHVVHEFEESVNFQAHPFLIQHIELFSNLADFYEKHPRMSLPKIILSTCNSLDIGDSRELFARLSADPNNLVVLTNRPPEGSLADLLLSGKTGEVTVQQLVKSPFSDEQLRQIYRESLEKEAQDDELRRRRIRERMPQQTSAAPSSAAAVPVDLIRAAGTYEGDSAGGNFFRPQLFAAQTVASGAVLGSQRPVNDYGESISTMDIDTWRAHAEMSDLGAAREAAAEMAAAERTVKAEKMVKGELMMRMKGDISEEGKIVKGELGTVMAAESSSFDWRRDLQIRFGEPQKVESRDRVFHIGCKVRFFAVQSSQQRREFVSSVKAESVVMLPTRNLHDIQFVSLMVRSEGNHFYATQEDIVPPLEELAGAQEAPIGLSVNLSIAGEKKWVHIDPDLHMSLPYKGLVDSDVRLARLTNSDIIEVMNRSPDVIQVPSGEFIDFTLAAAGDQKRQRRVPSSVLVSAKPFRLNDFGNLLKAQLPSGSEVEYVTSEDTGRVLSVKAMGGQVLVLPIKQGVVEIMGTPSPCFYKVRELLYSTTVAI